jgi:hypothetical protein
MGQQGNWFTSMFSGEAESGDLIQAGALNITKITALLVPIGTGVLAGVEAIAGEEGPLGALTPGQKLTVVIALIAFVAVVVVTDMLVRGLATASALRGPISPFPSWLTGTWKRPGKDLGCSIVAARSGSPGEHHEAYLLLVLTEEDDDWKKDTALWVPAGQVRFK